VNPVGLEAPDQYGVAGHPIAHSWSPFIHGMFAKATAQNLVYRLFDIAPENFRREALRLFAGGLKGLNVTLPHKQAAAELVNELTPRAERAKAVNTIAFFEQTSLLGDNTDGIGLMADLENNLGLALSGKRVLILGAGGAVRGVLGGQVASVEELCKLEQVRAVGLERVAREASLELEVGEEVEDLCACCERDGRRDRFGGRHPLTFAGCPGAPYRAIRRSVDEPAKAGRSASLRRGTPRSRPAVA